jgi:hypothetical protein
MIFNVTCGFSGSSVFQVSATDADKTSPNNVVTFILSGKDFVLFFGEGKGL